MTEEDLDLVEKVEALGDAADWERQICRIVRQLQRRHAWTQRWGMRWRERAVQAEWCIKGLHLDAEDLMAKRDKWQIRRAWERRRAQRWKHYYQTTGVWELVNKLENERDAAKAEAERRLDELNQVQSRLTVALIDREKMEKERDAALAQVAAARTEGWHEALDELVMIENEREVAELRSRYPRKE